MQPSPPDLPPSSASHRRRAVATTLVAALSVVALSVVATARTAAALDPITTIDGAAEGSAPAVRGERTQVEPIQLPPLTSGCLTGSVAKVSKAVDPAQRWFVGTVSSNWKVTFYPNAGRRGAVVVVGDSLTLGSETSLMRNLIDGGYGPICVDGGVSRRMTVGATSGVSNAVNVIARIKASDPVWRLPIVRWVLGIGTNDARLTNMPTYPATIQSGLTAVGTSDFPVWFINVRTRQLFNKPAEDLWNSNLQVPGITIIDWAAAADPALETYINGTDFIHLTAAGYTMRGALVRQVLDL